MQEKPQEAAFINFFLTFVNEEIVDVGYFPPAPKPSPLHRKPGSLLWPRT